MWEDPIRSREVTGVAVRIVLKVVLMLRLGATPYRCAACRCNFASFRPCKEKYSWQKAAQVAAAAHKAETQTPK